ncbi:SGS-domain-containing protein [Artomyces pyxidatus]|uniref:SGS-domain-containing protein n=1 Tax=Artomyces pyxidatus TaxID=48021 RepID=A0ACB8TIF9_9AGAM|nr:SGS-domain-containing protein [Artomyces pyxidatus]
MSHSLRHEYYETDEKLTVSIFDRGADPEQVVVKFEPRSVSLRGPSLFVVVYEHGGKKLVLSPLKGQIDPNQSDFVVGKVKTELRLVKAAQGRWGGLIGDSPDPLASSSFVPSPVPEKAGTTLPQARKNWDKITTTVLEAEKPKTSQEDPNVNGDNTLNEFFQSLYGNADEDTRRAMIKSFQESGGTALSTNWSEVGKAPVPIQPPKGSEARKW